MADIALTIDPDDTSLALHDNANGHRLIGYDAPSPEPKLLWTSSIDMDGSRRADPGFYENRVITARLLIEKSTDALLEAAENTLGKKVGKLAREGGELRFTYPTGNTITFNVLGATFNKTYEVVNFARKRAEYEIVFTCEPCGLGAEEDLGDNTETTLPYLVFTEASIKGDVPALGRLVIDDDSAVSQWWLTWGIESRYYSSSANAALYYEAEGRTAMGGSATAAGPSGASGGGSNVMRNTALLTSYLAILSTQATGAGAHLSHVGTFRVYARVQVPTTNTGEVTVALEWSEGDFLRATTNTATTIPAAQEGQWRLVDLGLVKLTQVLSGTQRWEGRIIAKSTVAGDDLDVDYLLLVPVAEGSGIVSGVLRQITPTAYVAEDHFTSTTGGVALNARVAPTGGTWATSGDATDFAFSDDGSQETVKRSAASGTNGRFGVIGSTNYAGVLVECTVAVEDLVTPDASVGVIARWTNSTNHLRAVLYRQSGTTTTFLEIHEMLSGTKTVLASESKLHSPFLQDWWRLLLTVDTAGTASATAIATGRVISGGGTTNVAGTVLLTATASRPSLATGGTLATGLPGIFDLNPSGTSSDKYFDDFLVASLPADAAMFASQSLEIRSDRVRREDSAGALWTPVSSYEGDYLLVPPAGAEGRTSRFVVKASRGDPLELDSGIDDISARLFVTPRYLNVPSA